jgi:DNA-binding transcriptional ArsR family regulator
MATDSDIVFKALADPHRRRILDLLRQRARTTGELVEWFDDIGRCAVMKHLGVLSEAGLVVHRREGRFRLNYLNPAPIREIYQRWMSPYVESIAAGMVNLKQLMETERNGGKR